jgi:TrmH family RNA methyltransferase
LYALGAVMTESQKTEAMTSPKNPLLKEVRRAASQATLTADGYALAEGFHLLDEALACRIEIGAVIASEGAQAALAERFSRRQDTRLIAVPDAVFAGLSTTEHTQGVMALVRPPRWTLEDAFAGTALTIVLDGVQDPGNAGAIVRSAEAFGATGVVFLKGSVNPYNPKCLRGSAGSVFRVPLVAAVDEKEFLDAAARHGAALFATAPRATLAIQQADFTGACAIVVGGEAKGVRETITSSATAVRIPTRAVESLNAAVACAVLLYEARRQRDQFV